MNAREFAKYHARLADRLRPTLMRGLRAGAARAIPYLVEQTRLAPPANPAGIGTGGAVNTGNLANGWRAKDIAEGAVLINIRSYSPVVDGGRRAGAKMPPKSAIVPWLMRRLGLSRKEAEARWFLVARAIQRRGLLPRQILTSPHAQEQILHLVHAEMVHELEAELERRL